MSFPSLIEITTFPFLIVVTAPATLTSTPATFSFSSAASASSSGSSSEISAASLKPSTLSAVSGHKESLVFVNFAPRTCPIFKQPSRLRSPESTSSSKIAGSSRFAGSIVIPPSALQHNTAGSFACAFAVSAVIDIFITS